jgi:hypothetical protein
MCTRTAVTLGVVVVDVKGMAFAFGDDGPVWERDLGGMVWAHPVVVDLDGDGDGEVVVTYGDGRVVALEFAPGE